MKRVIVSLMLVLAAAAVGTVFVNTDNAQRVRMQHAAVNIGRAMTIPGDPRLADPAEMYTALRDAAEQARVNVFRTAVGFTPDGRSQVTQYVLLTGGTGLFEAFSLREGRWITPQDADHPDRFLSSAQTPGQGQVGVLDDFGGDDLFAVRDLRRSFDSLAVAGTYSVEASDSTSYQRFLTALADEVSRLAGSAGSFKASTFDGGNDSFAGYSTDYASILVGAQYAIIFVTALFIAFQVLHEAKKAGVMKLHGYGSIAVWFAISGRTIVLSLIASEAVALMASRSVPDTTWDFTFAAGLAVVRAFAVMLVASIVASVYVLRVNIANSIKNRKDTRGVFALNTLIKIACTVTLIAVGSGLWLQYATAVRERQELGNWERARGYGIFYPGEVGNDLVEFETGGNATVAAEVYDLYPLLNRRGALYVDAKSYEPSALAEGLPPDAYRSMEVNVNFLQRFPVRDESGRPVEVGEETSDWVLLVPSRYRSEQTAITTYFQRLRTGGAGQEGAVQAEQAVFDRPPPDTVAHQRVSVIWTQNGQQVFTFDPTVDPRHGNNVFDPIIEVMTTANSLGIDRANMIGGGSGALKVRLLDGDTIKTLQDLEPALRSLKLDDNLPYLVTMDEFAARQIADLDNGIRSVAIAGLALFAALLVLAVQSISILFERYSRKITVRKLFGAGFARKYREPLLLFSAVWIAQLVGALIANRFGLNPFSTQTSRSVAADGVVLVMAAVVALGEGLFSFGVLTFIENRSVVRVLKQEF